MPNFASHGKLAGELAARLLEGEKGSSIPLHTSNVETMIDWRQLQHWRLDVERLPPGLVSRFQEPTIWQRYKWQISAVAALCLAQTLLISGLLIQRRRRRRAEREVESLAGRLITAQETERSRIARELHDDVNQQLAGLSIALSNVKRELQNGGNGIVQEGITRLQQRTMDLADVIRNLSHELHPGVLQHVGLVAALRGHCAEFGRQHAIDVTFSAVDLPGDIPQEVALCLYRVAQEALSNIAEHAAARKAQVNLRSTRDGLELVVADDGQGFDLTEARETGGLGLISLNERVRLVGGSLAVSTEPQRGTEIRAQVPLGGSR
jgi:signal transduction histidine kinase